MNRVLTILLAAAAVFLGVALVPVLGGVRGPANHRGFSPAQPIAFSHRLHAGELGVDCLYCHGGAEKSRRAGIPAASTCMNCHRFVTAPIADVRAEEKRAAAEERKPERVVSPELAKLYDALGLDGNLERDPAKTPRPIEWVRVHDLPDFVWFDHRPHVAAGVACESCHGPVANMERVRQEFDLSMGFCLDCHRTTTAAPKPGTDCSICHF